MATDPRETTDLDRPPARPRWVKVSIIIVLALAAVFLVLKLAGIGGEHGPGRHVRPGGTSESNGTEHRPPPGVPNHGG